MVNLHDQMQAELVLRGLAPATQKEYLLRVKHLAKYYAHINLSPGMSGWLRDKSGGNRRSLLHCGLVGPRPRGIGPLDFVACRVPPIRHAVR